eukprot:TRINITY_DN5495_c0_g4_i2.p1 TRINITY_DN5495_c0_g4~~TRINITY_DN5495_c0_g4_i2.p1  ORF type:complete len:465 (+),score=97.29 TRINITY_DN5495_c0_g4_i2:153-1547(+)
MCTVHFRPDWLKSLFLDEPRRLLMKFHCSGNGRKFSVDNSGTVAAFYRIGEKLGKGAFGSVRRVERLQTEEPYAMKTVPKERHLTARSHAAARTANAEYAKQLDREIALMKGLEHQNIVRLVETFEDEDRIFFIMEFCAGGELLDFIVEQNRFSEAQAVTLMRQVFSAVEYMHDLNVVHRDMKLANCLLLTREAVEQNVLKIIDFGLSIQMSGDQALRASQGTPYFMAPQVLKGTAYDSSADMWSCGVILYVLLCGYPPFGGSSANAVIAKVIHGNFSFNDADWGSVSEDARSLIRGMLKMQPRDRLTAKQALEHRWFQVAANRTEDLPSYVISNMQSFGVQTSKRKLEQASQKRVSHKQEDGLLRILPGRETVLNVMEQWFPAQLLCCSDKDEVVSRLGSSFFVESPTDIRGIANEIGDEGYIPVKDLAPGTNDFFPVTIQEEDVKPPSVARGIDTCIVGPLS